MEELSIEEKAKGYDDALERAKSAIKECGNNVGRIKMIESIFPELKEGEDEKIRKKLIEYFKGLMGGWFTYSNEEIISYLEKLKDFDKQLEQAYKTADEVQYNRGYRAAMEKMEKQDKQTDDCPQNHQDVNRPNGCITMEDFSGGEGFYKLHLDYLSKKQVEEVEEMVKMWNKGLKASNENIKACIGMCLTDVDEQRFKDYDTSLKDCLAWLEKQGEQSITISVDKMVGEFEDFKVISCGRIPSFIEIDAYRKGVVDTLSKILIKEEKPITVGSKKAEGKLGEMIAASKEPAESGEDEELSHKEVTKKSDKDKEIDTRSLLFHKDDRNYEVIKLIRSAMLYCPHMEEEDRKKVNDWLKFVQSKLS